MLLIPDCFEERKGQSETLQLSLIPCIWKRKGLTTELESRSKMEPADIPG